MIAKDNFPKPFPIVSVVGPTATGKTAVAIKLAKRIKGEIINLDSVQIYRGLDIGSAKPTRQELAEVPHHLIDIRDPWDVMDAPSFARIATMAVKRVMARGRVPVLVGGTGFYLKALEEGLSTLPGTMPALRDQVKEMIRLKGHEEIHKTLQTLDPQRASQIHPRDTYRLARALEVLLSGGGASYQELCQRHRWRPLEEGMYIFKIGLIFSRHKLYSRIDKRVDMMLEQGFLEEVIQLLKKGLSPALKPLQSIGYRHIISYLLGEKELSQAIFEMKRDTRRYAKRQITWFRKDPSIKWFNPEQLMNASDIWKAVN
ncbi:MAG: tRNA (adenosine(37)-N6)-dimethylallyltransferase MiaA [Thermodesulfobacteria bacterium]|nr:tRNA (adenosine(37)-N6)-dimethylallyltransferase MiaA [Thermodesulfobacteriota bacterium]